MDEILSKRIIQLSNAIILLCAIGFLALIHHIDANYKAKEYSALNKLRNCIESLPADASDKESDNLNALSWLKANQTAIYNSNLDAGEKLELEFTEAGFKDELLNFINPDSPGEKISPSGFVLTQISSTDPEKCCEHGLGKLTGNNKLMHFAEQYHHILTPTRITIVTGIKPNSIREAIGKTRMLYQKETADNPDRLSVQTMNELEDLWFSGDSIHINFKITTRPDLHAAYESIAIPAETKTIDGPRWADLFGIDSVYLTLGDKTELQKIVKHYGDLPMDKAVDMIGEDYMEAYESVDVFGFSFSTTSLPLALLVFFLMLSTGLFLMVREAERRKLKSVSEINNEDITDYFIKRPRVRFLIWLLMPLLALLATLPALPVELEKLIVLGTGALVLTIMNLITLRRASRI